MTLVTNAINALIRKAPELDRVPLSNQPYFNAASGVSTINDSGRLNRMDSVGWLFAAIDLIAAGIAASEWKVYRRKNDDREEVLPQSRQLDRGAGLALYELLHGINPFYTREQFFESVQQHYELTGRMYWLLLRPTPTSPPLEIWPLRPDRVRPVPHRQEFIEGYVYQSGADRIPLRREDVIWIRRPNPTDPYGSISVISSLSNDIEADRQASLYTRKFFENDATPGGIIQVDELLQDHELDRLREHWRSQHQGTNNAHRVAFIEGSKWVDRGRITQRDMQFDSLRKMDRDVILGAMKIQPALLGVTENVNLANARMALTIHNQQVIIPRLRKIRAEINEHLAPQFSPDLEVDFVDPTPENRELALAEATQLFGGGLITRNEAREHTGWPGADLRGDDYVDAGTMATGTETISRSIDPRPVVDMAHFITGKISDPLITRPEEQAEEAMVAGWTRRLKAELQEVLQLLDRTKGMNPIQIKTEMSDFNALNLDWYQKYGDEVTDEISIAYQYAMQAGLPGIAPPRLQFLAGEYARVRAADLLRLDGSMSMSLATRNRIRELAAATIEQGRPVRELINRLQEDDIFSVPPTDVAKRQLKTRAERIARTETATALGQGRRQVGLERGDNEKRWFTQGGDPRVDSVCLENEAQGWIPFAQSFQSGHDFIPAHINCMCNVITRFNPDYRLTRSPYSDGVDRSGGFHSAAAQISPNFTQVPFGDIKAEARCPKCKKLVQKDLPAGIALQCPRCKERFDV